MATDNDTDNGMENSTHTDTSNGTEIGTDSTCGCAGLWREGTGDIWKLERAAAAMAAELVAAEATGSAMFTAFDSTVHR